MTQIKSTVGLIGLNYGTIGSAMMKNESDLKATLKSKGGDHHGNRGKDQSDEQD